MTLQFLYIEDDLSEQETFIQVLKHSVTTDLKIDTAETGEEGIEKIRDYNYDLAIIDNRLPDISGIEILEEMRRIQSKTPVIMLTGSGDEYVAVQAMKLGAKDYIKKGDINPLRIISAINEVLLEVSLPKDIPRETLERIQRLFSKTDYLEIEQEIQLTSPRISEEITPEIIYGLERLATSSFVEKESPFSTIFCPSCKSYDHTLRLECPECSSTVIQKSTIIQHMSCGYVDFEKKFIGEDGRLSCPKCREELKAIGVDYVKPGVSYKCSNSHLFPSLKVQMHCSVCGEKFELNDASLKTVHQYRLRKEGKLKMQLGLHSEKDFLRLTPFQIRS
ncbi:MAG: response regulator [Candidatus Bathyarchaeota archaeon]